MASILLTGCAGFIGAKVCETLLEMGHAVVGVDNLNQAYDVRLKQWRLSQLTGRAGFTFHPLDIVDRHAMRRFWTESFSANRSNTSGWSAVINLAARAGVRPSVEDPWLYYDTNVTGTLNLLELCHEFGVRKFVQASTSSVYGDSAVQPFTEDAVTDRPLSPYAASKKAAEVLCHTYHHLYGLDVTVLRYFTVYGPAGRPDMSMFRFVQWISRGRPVTIYGDGQQSRDFTYVDDVAHGTVAGLKPLGYEVINLGSDRPVVLIEIIRLIEDRLGRRARLEFEPRHPADVLATWANIEKAGRLLEWRPHTAIETGVERLVSWYQENESWAQHLATE
ncbi:MAG: GDP-mannose 4,6-dehydratase [Acidobacteriota bacterium]|nr:GDP-mannose 4,6-dehydratase [Blastocatellia bacterium]MDW8238675.1 GDP-mannose 4,6-dehydratase [Acidobacteriota bacterium]